MDLTNTYWLNVGGADNHHILYSANEAWVGAFARIGGKMWPLKFPVEPLLALTNDLAGPMGEAKGRAGVVHDGIPDPAEVRSDRAQPSQGSPPGT